MRENKVHIAWRRMKNEKNRYAFLYRYVDANIYVHMYVYMCAHMHVIEVAHDSEG